MKYDMKHAKYAKVELETYLKGSWANFTWKVSIFFHKDELALKIVFNKHTNTTWKQKYYDLPLFVEQPPS